MRSEPLAFVLREEVDTGRTRMCWLHSPRRRQPAAADPQQTGTAILQHLQPTADANAQLGQAADPASLARNLGDFAPFAGSQQFQR